jgi:hypothetical protein
VLRASPLQTLRPFLLRELCPLILKLAQLALSAPRTVLCGLGPFLRAGFARVDEESARKSGPMRPVLSGRGPVGPLGPFVSTKGLGGSAVDGRPLGSEMPIQEGALLVYTNPRACAYKDQAAYPITLRIETNLSAAVASLSHRGP